MKANSKKRIGLMLVEDPEETITALCEIKKETIHREDFIENYKKIKCAETFQNNQIKKMTDSNIDAHFYSLTTFNFLVKVQEGYQLSRDAKQLCSLRKKQQWDDYQTLLSSVLLNNDRKGKLYQEFLKFVNFTTTKDEIFKNFGIIPGKTLISWTKHAYLILEYKDKIQAFHQKDELPSTKDFINILKEKYQLLDHSEVFGIRNIFVPIGELRFYVCIQLGIKKKDFDKLFLNLLSTDFGVKIDLHGTTSKGFHEEESESFEFMGKLYIFMSLKQ